MQPDRSGGAVTPRLRTRPVLLRVFLAAVCMAVAPLLVNARAASAAPVTSFSLSADFVGLFPGADLGAPVTARNPQPYALIVKTASVSISDAGPGCAASNVTVQSFSGDVTVPAGGSATIPVRIQMSPSAPDACQGATFPLQFQARGEGIGNQPPTSGFAFTRFSSGGLVLAVVGAGSLLAGLALLFVKRRANAVPR